MIAKVLILIGCHSNGSMKDIAAYVGDPKHGLMKEEIVGQNRVVCQFIPQPTVSSDHGLRDSVFEFRVFIDNPADVMNDSLFYDLSYQSTAMFSIIGAGDTLHPVMSERIVNGRKDQHEFTVLFTPSARLMIDKGPFSFVIRNHKLFKRDIQFQYQSNDITKASKTM